MVRVMVFSTMPQLAWEGWDPNALSGDDYDTPRADALYAALGVSKSDEEYALARHRDGRWGLFGLTQSGHRYAEETPTISAEYAAKIERLSREAERVADELARALREAGDAADATDDAASLRILDAEVVRAREAAMSLRIVRVALCGSID